MNKIKKFLGAILTFITAFVTVVTLVAYTVTIVVLPFAVSAWLITYLIGLFA